MELPELRFFLGDHADLQVTGLEVQGQDRGQARYSQLERQKVGDMLIKCLSKCESGGIFCSKYLPLLKQKLHLLNFSLQGPFISINIQQVGRQGFSVLLKDDSSGHTAVNGYLVTGRLSGPVYSFISVLFSSASRLRSSANWVSLYLYCPVVGQLRLFLQLLLQVAIGLCLFGPDCCGSEATVVACWVAFIQDRTLLGVHSHHDHTCGEQKRREREGEDETR